MPQRKPIAFSLSPIGERAGSGEVLPGPVKFDYGERMFPASNASPLKGRGLTPLQPYRPVINEPRIISARKPFPPCANAAEHVRKYRKSAVWGKSVQLR